MPACSSSCPKVKRDLKRRNAERKRALESVTGSFNRYSEDVTLPIGQELYPESLELGSHNKNKNETRGHAEDSEGDYSETTSRNTRSIGSRRRAQNGSRQSDDEIPYKDGKGHDKSLRKKNRNESSGNTDSDFEESNVESRIPGRRNRANRSQDCDLESNHKSCSPECHLQKIKDEFIQKKFKAKQKAVEDYTLHTGLNYFKNFCTCSSVCLIKQLWYDPFVNKIMVSSCLFALGIKLCCEMDAWYIPT